MESPSTLAQAFVRRHSDYIFEDAHFLVEAAAVLEAQEFAPNKFRFKDDSVLEILSHRAKLVCHASLRAAGY